MASTPQQPPSSKDVAPAPPPQTWVPSFNPWLIAVVVAMAAFMEVLDTSIANVALPYMAGNLGASNDESTWVLTSYLVSNAVVLPISGWFASVLGRKHFFMICLVIFTISSLLCGIAPSLGAIIFFRILQGVGGGGLQPMAQAILADTFPPEKRGLAFALYGVTVIVAPTIGPTLGGWITDNYTWRWIFFINLPVGILALFLVWRLVEDPPWAGRVKDALSRIDYVGVSLLVLGVGSLQILLDKGQEDDWFGSRFIVTLIILAATGLISLVFWELYQKYPIIDMRLYKNGNFIGANLMIFFLGMELFASLVMIPQFLQTLMGYTAESAGLVLSGGALVLLFMMPLAGVLSGKIQARYLAATGWGLLAIGLFYSSRRLDLDISFQSASTLRIEQVIGLGFLFVPINLISYVGVAPEKSSSVAGLVNFMRNMGSSVGTSLVTTLIARRSQVHQLYLSANTSGGNVPFQRSAAGITQRLVDLGMDPVRAGQQANAIVSRQVLGQAATLAYLDTFVLLSIGAFLMVILCFFLKANKPGAGRVALD
jgi:DHA2 family multidrug resistance protein